jgi:hypothetical protein
MKCGIKDSNLKGAEARFATVGKSMLGHSFHALKP